jgi:hypothetical protein
MVRSPRTSEPVQSCRSQFRDEAWKIRDLQHHTIPAARLLLLSVRHRPRARCARAAEQNLRGAKGDVRKRGELLVLQLEPEALRIERHRTGDVLHLVSDTVDALDEYVLCCLAGGCLLHFLAPLLFCAAPPAILPHAQGIATRPLGRLRVSGRRDDDEGGPGCRVRAAGIQTSWVRRRPDEVPVTPSAARPPRTAAS